jgi:hypothetical protein
MISSFASVIITEALVEIPGIIFFITDIFGLSETKEEISIG